MRDSEKISIPKVLSILDFVSNDIVNVKISLLADLKILKQLVHLSWSKN